MQSPWLSSRLFLPQLRTTERCVLKHFPMKSSIFTQLLDAPTAGEFPRSSARQKRFLPLGQEEATQKRQPQLNQGTAGSYLLQMPGATTDVKPRALENRSAHRLHLFVTKPASCATITTDANYGYRSGTAAELGRQSNADSSFSSEVEPLYLAYHG